MHGKEYRGADRKARVHVERNSTSTPSTLMLSVQNTITRIKIIVNERTDINAMGFLADRGLMRNHCSFKSSSLSTP